MFDREKLIIMIFFLVGGGGGGGGVRVNIFLCIISIFDTSK